jgi:hypothetical protein
MILDDSREPLDEAIADADATILVLSGAEDSTAGEIHEFIDEREWEEWHHWFLVTDVSMLTPTMQQDWKLDTDDRYVVLGGGNPKKVGPKAKAEKLLRVNGKPSVLKITQAFAKGDAL